MTKISPRSRQYFSEISAAKNSPGISPRVSPRLARSQLKFCTGCCMAGTIQFFFPLEENIHSDTKHFHCSSTMQHVWLLHGCVQNVYTEKQYLSTLLKTGIRKLKYNFRIDTYFCGCTSILLDHSQIQSVFCS